MKKEELAWVFGGLEEGKKMVNRTKNGEKKRTVEEDDEQWQRIEIESVKVDLLQ